MRNAFVRALLEVAEKNKNIELLTGDLGFGVLKPFFERLPDQFTDVGIAEQNMAAMAAGMALSGRIVFMYSIGNFPTLRCLEQIRNDCAYHHANVKIVCVGGGLVYGALGMSHHATEDIACMRALPDVTVICPGDLVEAEAATKAMVDHPGTVYLRLGRGGEKRIHQEIKDFRIGKAIRVHKAERTDNRISLLSTGAILDEATVACELLEKQGIGVDQYSFPTVKPIDVDCIAECCRNSRLLATLEEHNIVGGFGGAVAEVMAESGTGCRLLRIGLRDEYCSKVGSQAYLREQFGLDGRSVAGTIAGALA